MPGEMIERFRALEDRTAAFRKQELVDNESALAGRLASVAAVKAVAHNADIITRDTPGRGHMCFLLAGEARLIRGGREMRHRPKPGQAFGEFPLLDVETPHDVTLRAKGPHCVVAEVAESDMRAIAEDYPVLWYNMSRMLARRLAAMNPPVDGPRIFISHRHADAVVAEDLARVLEAAFHLSAQDLRCTSVDPYCLDPADRTDERLCSEIKYAAAVVGLVGPATVESTYVVAELGGSWTSDSKTIPVLIHGAKPDSLPGPLRGLNAISLEVPENCWKLIDALDVACGLERKHGHDSDILRREVRRLAASAAG